MAAEIEKQLEEEEPTAPLSPNARTELGERLMAIRRRVVVSGEPLLDAEQISRYDEVI